MERTINVKQPLGHLSSHYGSCQKLNLDKEKKLQRIFSLPLLFLREELDGERGRKGENS